MKTATTEKGTGESKLGGIAQMASRFGFRKGISFRIGSRQKVDCTPSGTVISLSGPYRANLPELLALAKLGEEDHLLATFHFLRGSMPAEAEESFCRDFCELCGPLQDAWAFRMLRDAAPDLYERVIREAEVAAEAESARFSDGSSPQPDKRYLIGLMTVLHECPSPRLRLSVEPVPAGDKWVEGYLEALRSFSRMDPDPSLYVRLPEIIGASYRVRVVESGGSRFYEIMPAPAA